MTKVTMSARRTAPAAHAPSDVAPPLAEARLAPPRVPRAVVVRPRIRTALDAGADSVLTLVGAPAGYGKTTAVRTWCAGQDAKLAWVTVGADLNDANRLWTYVATAVDRLRPGLGQPAMRRMRVGGVPIEQAVDELMNALGGYGERVIIVLDDLQEVTDLECLASIDHALLNAPENVRVIVVTRIDPTLGLARLRAAQELTELRASELAFTPGRRTPCSSIDSASSWAMSRSTPFSSARRDGPRRSSSPASGCGPSTIPPMPCPASAATSASSPTTSAPRSSRRSTTTVAPSSRVSPCSASSRRSCATRCSIAATRPRSWSRSSRRNLFVSRLGRGDWFSIHALFADYARAQLEASDPGATARIHRRAAQWLREQGRPMEAIGHASAAGEHG